MNYRNFVYNSITVSFPKNTIQFFLGAVLFWIIFGTINIITALTAFLAFILTYSSIYLYNDIVDYKEDRKDKEKLKWKLVAGNKISLEKAMILSIIFVISGLTISFFINKWFVLILCGLLFLNFLHSSPFTKFKKSMYKTTVNMTLIEYLKYSIGWFALTPNISKFPFWMILGFAVVYTTSYLIYKFKFKRVEIRQRKPLFSFLIGGCLALYVISVINYGFPLSLTFLLTFLLVLLLSLKIGNFDFHKIKNMLVIEHILLPLIILSFLMLMNPVIASTNDQIVSDIHSYKENISSNIPENVKKPLENLSNELEKFQSLDDLESKVNLNFLLSSEANP
jgi:4-hydroxybenzoate polyprenyltransferase